MQDVEIQMLMKYILFYKLNEIVDLSGRYIIIDVGIGCIVRVMDVYGLG